MRYSSRISGHPAARSGIVHVVSALILPRRAVLGAVAVTALATTAALAQDREKRFVAPTDRTITTSLEEGLGSTLYQVISIRNESTVPIHVYSVTLRDCQNIRQDCTPLAMSLRVRPGEETTLRRVEPKNPDRGFSFRYTFGWRADSSDAVALRLLAGNGVTRAQQMVAAQTEDAAAQKAAAGVHDIDLGADDIAKI